ncbi:MAG: glycosyltransferase [Bacteroidales bacterium]
MKLLILLSRVPYPLEKGDKLRAFNQLRILSQFHEIYLVALNADRLHPQAIEKLQPFCKEIHIINLNIFSKIRFLLRFLWKGLPLQCGYFYSKKAAKDIRWLIQSIQPDHIYCQLVRVAEYVKEVPIKKTIDYQDVFSKGIFRRYQKAPFYLKPFLKLEYLRLSRYERAIFPYFDHKTIITAVDRDLIPHTENEKIHVIANGVDFDQYQYKGEKKEFDLIFSGNMNYPPNIEAAEYLAKQIFPQLKKKFPHLTLVLCGANPSPKVLTLRKKDIIVTGWVNSMAAYYAKSKIFIAPMHLGTGLQNKLLEAMAMKLPCITSSLAGKPLEGIENGKDILICSTATGYIEAVKLLLTNPEAYCEMAENGYRFVTENYNWEAITYKLNDLISQ